jgi:hypothetical protein
MWSPDYPDICLAPLREGALIFSWDEIFAGFQNRDTLRVGSVCSPINSRALTGHRRSRGAPATDRRASALESAAAVDRAVRNAQLAHRERTARLLLNKLAERGFIKLPPRQRGGGRRILRALSEPELFSLSAGGGELIEGPLRTLQPLEVIPVEPRTTQANAFVCHLANIITWASRVPQARTCAT